jgi:predicted GNAT superfamily acetyltransferase
MAILVPIPADIQQLKEDDPDAALAWRAATRNALAPRLGYHWEIIELVRAEEPVSYYQVRR